MIQKTLLISGLAFILACFALPLSYTHVSEESISIAYSSGFECESYFINLLLIAGILCASFIGRGSYTAFFLVLLFIGGFLVLMNTTKHVVPGLAWGYYPTVYQYLLYVANLLVIISGFIHILRLRKTFTMEKIRLINRLLMYIGLAYILCCFFLPLTTSCEGSDGPEEYINTTQTGIQVPTFIINVFLIGLMIVLTYIENKSYIAPIIVTIVGLVLVFFINSFREAGFGQPCGFSPTVYMRLLYVADLLIIISGFVRIYLNRKANNEKS